MVIQINKNNELKAFQQQFSAYYPFLKIEFFKKISVNPRPDKTNIVFGYKPPEQVERSGNGLINIDVNQKRTITELEKDFDKALGLSARIYRKSGNVWVETSLTNDWCLGEQNEEGKQISSHFIDRDSNAIN